MCGRFVKNHQNISGFLLLLATLYNPLANADVEFTLGIVPQYDSREIAAIWDPLIHKIEQETGIRLKLVGSPSIPDFEESFGKGKFDFAYMNPYHALVAHRKQKYKPILRDIGRKLYGVIVVRKDSTIKNIRDLHEKKIAFPSPNALGASLIPRAEFSVKYNIDVNPLYVKSHDSVYLNVLLGQTDAGGGVQKTFNKQSSRVKNQLRVLYKTGEVSPHPIVAHPRVGKDIVGKVTDAFLKIGRSDEGKKLLNKIPIKIIGPAGLKDYLELEEMGLTDFYVENKSDNL